MAEKNKDTNNGHINGGFVQDNGDEKVSAIFFFCKKTFQVINSAKPCQIYCFEMTTSKF